MACIQDSTSVTLSQDLSTGRLQADLVVSEDPQNILEVVDDGVFVSATALVIPTGCVIPYAGGAAPSGWVLCDGSAISRSLYSDLFAIISVTYGIGDGSTTFNVPDLRGRVVVGLNGSNTDVDAMGENDGLAAGFRSPLHNHTIAPNPHTHTYQEGGSGASAPAGAIGGIVDSHTTGSTSLAVGPGGSRPTDTPAFLVLKHIIKA